MSDNACLVPGIDRKEMPSSLLFSVMHFLYDCYHHLW